jgi:hypothetical protein
MKMPIRFLLILIILLCTESKLEAQSPELFSRKDLKGFSKIICTYRDEKKILPYKRIYIVTSNGDVARHEDYEDGILTEWRDYRYTRNGLMKSETRCSRIFYWDEKTERDTFRLDETILYGREFEYKGKQLRKITCFSSHDGSRTNNLTTLIDYDRKGRKIKETSTDYSVGLGIQFKPNSTEIDSSYARDRHTTTWTTYGYHGDKIVSIEHDHDGRIVHSSVEELDKNNRVVLYKEKDHTGTDFRITSYQYDASARLIREKLEFLDPDRIPYDYSIADDEEIKYNRNSLPIRIITRAKGKVIQETLFTYKK